MSLVAGDRIGERYRVLAPIGEGGMASVFLVEEEPTGQTRVLKQLRLDSPELLDAFRVEFSLLAGVTHPSLTRVHDFGSWRVRGELYHYYTADWIEGVTFAEFAARPERASADLVRPLLDALDGLSVLHDLGMCHGDFSPDNVLVRQSGRGVLIDLGCARPFGKRQETVGGTPGFMAPEVLRDGAGDARADLYSVGATLRFGHETTRAPLDRHLANLVERLLSPDPGERPASAREVLEQLGVRSTPGRSLGAVARRLFGRQRERAVFLDFLGRVRDRLSGPRVLHLVGPPGSGKSRLLRDLLAHAELEQTVLRAHAVERAPVRWLLGAATGARDLGTGAREGLAAARALAGRGEPLLLALEDIDRLEPTELGLLLSFARSLDAEGSVGLLLSGPMDIAGVLALRVELSPLDLADLRGWTGGSLSEGALESLLAASGGVPGLVESELERIALARGGASRPAPEPPTDAARLEQVLAELPESERASLSLLAALGGNLDGDVWSIGVDDLAQAIGVDLVRRDRSHFRLRDRADLPALERALGRPALAQAHARVAGALQVTTLAGMPEDVRHAEIVQHSALSGDTAGADRALAAAGPLLRANARACAARLAGLLSLPMAPPSLLLVAEISLLAGEMRQALGATARLLARRPAPAIQAAARLLAADALTRLGRPRRAERVVARLVAGDQPDEVRARALERVARARIQSQDPSGAESAARSGLALDPEATTTLALREVQGMAASYLGRPAEALACFAEALDELPESASPRDRCRLLGQRAIAAFRTGKLAQAAEGHAQALALAERHALDDLVCVGLLNLGTTEQQAGDLGAALSSYERALAVARALGRESTELTLRYNLANLRVEVGDLPGATRELEALEGRAAAASLGRLAPDIALARAELCLIRGEPDAAERELLRALSAFEELRLSREQVEVAVLLAEVDLARGLWERAGHRADEAERKASELRAEDLSIRAACVVARAALAGPQVERQREGRRRLDLILAQAVASGQRLLEAKVATEIYLAAVTLREPGVTEKAEHARRLWDRLAANLPEGLREAFWRDARRARLERFTRVERVASPRRDDAEALRRLLSLSRRLNSSLALERVLDYAVLAAVELTGAERGFLLFAEPGGGEARVGAEHASAGASEPPSRSIVARVLSNEEAVLTTDAEADDRFRGHGSVHALRLKSVLCVPVSTPAGILGALYVDSRLERTRFEEGERQLLVALADHVAMAIANARAHAELERRARQIDEQKRVLERLSRSKDRELERLRGRVEEQQRVLGLRYDYSRIVGRSAPMRQVLEQVDRVIDSPVSTLIQGESGTGKELVARAIHVNGARKTGPFIGVNCAAIPETLLESELFGYVRGAFTGADRDKKGLMASAHGGTLFLDEIGEMPTAMQAKLLRVLQEREVRPLGAARATAIDIRLVCASHRDLAAAVEAGRFREDLFYRVAVVIISLPPLRERVEDIPELARAILERVARESGRKPPELGSDALRVLATHSFPGNVRELENVLTRAFVLGASSRIGAADLGLLRAPARRSKSATRREFRAEEKSRILEALRSSRWNVSQVSRVLGIPRNTLYRKIGQYDLRRQA